MYPAEFCTEILSSNTSILIEIFHFYNPSGHTMAPGFTHLLTEMSTRNIYWSKGGRYVGLTLPPSCSECHETWDPKGPGTPGIIQTCTGIAVPLLLPYINSSLLQAEQHRASAGQLLTAKRIRHVRSLLFIFLENH
jgi:hypothetical protein